MAKLFENKGKINCCKLGQSIINTNNNNDLHIINDKLSTTFQQKLWKRSKHPFHFVWFLFLSSILLLASCTFFKASKEKPSHPALQNSIISMTEEEVRKKVGEPDMVSKTPDNKIIWTYKPSWKLIPDNKDTVYVEFEDGKVSKIIKAR